MFDLVNSLPFSASQPASALPKKVPNHKDALILDQKFFLVSINSSYSDIFCNHCCLR